MVVYNVCSGYYLYCANYRQVFLASRRVQGASADSIGHRPRKIRLFICHVFVKLVYAYH